MTRSRTATNRLQNPPGAPGPPPGDPPPLAPGPPPGNPPALKMSDVFTLGDRVSVKYPDGDYTGKVVKINKASVLIQFDVDGSEALFTKSKLRFVDKL